MPLKKNVADVASTQKRTIKTVEIAEIFVRQAKLVKTELVPNLVELVKPFVEECVPIFKQTKSIAGVVEMRVERGRSALRAYARSVV